MQMDLDLTGHPKRLEPERGAGTSEGDARRSDDAEARRLEATGRFKILRMLERLQLTPDIGNVAAGSNLRFGVVLDTETTSLDTASCEVIELAMLRFAFDRDGIRGIVASFEGLRQPKTRLVPDIVRLTGLTDADLVGRSIDAEEVTRFVKDAEVIVAHNAAFDRPVVERFWPVFADKPWSCSATEIDWKARGHESAKLGHLLASHGYFNGSHRALADCEALTTLLQVSTGPNGRSAFQDLVASSDEPRVEMRAEGAPYDMRSVLKGAGYRWDPGTAGRPKCWFKIVPKSQVGSETHFLRYEIYRDRRLPVVRELTPFDRYRA